MKQAIALIDSNNFYASCEQSIDPSLSGQPLVVLSNNDGCIVARSTEARDLGIKMGQPYFMVRQKLEAQSVIVRSSNYALYGDMSQRLMRLLKIHCEHLEVYSIDEAFVKLSRPCNYSLHPWARQLRALVSQNLGLSISIGIGTSKGQAKLANYIAKKTEDHAGIFDLITAESPDAWLKDVDIENVWGIGRSLAQWCRMRGINNALQLRDMPSRELRAKCGVVGIRIQHELHGKSCLQLATTPAQKKETCVSSSFSRPISDIEELRQAIAIHVIRASEKLRQQKQRAKVITIFIRTSPFKPAFYSQTASTQLDVASNDTNVLLKASLELTSRIFQPYNQLVKAGVVMKKLQGIKYLQGQLVAGRSTEKEQRSEQLMKTIDKLNHQYGKGTISWAICGRNQNWRMRREQLSKAATTRITEIPTVQI